MNVADVPCRVVLCRQCSEFIVLLLRTWPTCLADVPCRVVSCRQCSEFIALLLQTWPTCRVVSCRQCSEFIALLLQTWPTSVLERQNSALYEAIKKGISDADPDARVNSRRSVTQLCYQLTVVVIILLSSLSQLCDSTAGT